MTLDCFQTTRSLKVTHWGLSESLGWILIDRCGKHFGTILNYLRDDTIVLPQNRQEIKELMAEAKYYLIQGLVDMCQAALQVRGQGGAGTYLRGWFQGGWMVAESKPNPITIWPCSG